MLSRHTVDLDERDNIDCAGDGGVIDCSVLSKIGIQSFSIATLLFFATERTSSNVFVPTGKGRTG